MVCRLRLRIVASQRPAPDHVTPRLHSGISFQQTKKDPDEIVEVFEFHNSEKS
jgi:hypothetical protein